MSRIRTNLITNRMANGAPTVSNGLVISGVTTVTTLDVSGTVGIGSVTPANILDVQGGAHSKIHVGTTGTSHATGIQINHAKGNAALQEWQLQTDASADGNLLVRNATSGTSTMFFDADTNNVGINETSPDRKLHVGGSFIRVDDGYGLDTSGATERVTLDNGFITLTTNSLERLRIDSSGQFALGRTGQITANGNQSTSVFEQLSNNNYPLALHSAQTNNRGLAIFYATTGAGNAGDPFIVCTDNTNNKFQVTSDGTITNRGNILPAVNNSKDLGSSSLRWANLYTQDLQLSNEAKKDTGGNSVDGTWGDWTLQEGESDVFMINNRNGKKYMFMLKEVV